VGKSSTGGAPEGHLKTRAIGIGIAWQNPMMNVAGFLLLFALFLSSSLFAGPREEVFVHHEQNDNIKEIYKQGVFDTELPEKYQSDQQASFRLPYFLIPLDSPELRQVQIDAMPADIARLQVIEKKGKKFFKYLVHPAVLNYHKEKFGGKFDSVSQNKSEFLASPTASERTLVLVEPASAHYMVKLNLPLKINHRDRTMYPTEIKRGVWLTAAFHDVFAKNPDLKNKFFIFDESFGVYPKVNGEALGGIVFREFSPDFYEPNKEVMPLFTLLALNPATQKPLFFDYMKPGQDPWLWFEGSVLNPFLEIINKVTYEEAFSLELHSQNVVVKVDTAKKQIDSYGYRDLGSTHLDFFTLNATHMAIPRLEMVQDAKRELGGAYAKKTELEWLKYFFKNQISDLFFIQMAAHGLITREQREAYKKKAWDKVVENHQSHYQGGTYADPLGAFDEIFDKVLAFSQKPGPRCQVMFQ
jgi:hypothetical protein